MTIRQNLVAASKYSLKCPHPMTAIGICVHNTANDASAINESAYMIGNTLSTSFHLVVDDIEAIQNVPFDRNAWHAGDGADGAGNRKHIGIEICYSESGGFKFLRAEENAAELIAQLLKERSWGIDRVKKHQDFSGKRCPHRTLDLGWDRFLNMVKVKLGGAMPDTIAVPVADWEKVRDNSETLDKTTDYLGLGRNAQYDLVREVIEKKSSESFNQGFAAGKAASPTPTEPPQTMVIRGETWALNGVQWNKGELIGNYYKV